MSVVALQVLEQWRLDVDDRDEIVIVGTVDGEAAGGPLASLDADCRVARDKDGRAYSLDDPAPAAGDDPFVPPAAHQKRRLARLKTALARIATGDLPDGAELASAPTLEQWALAEDGGFTCLVGIFHGHPRIGDREAVTTSPVVWLAADRTSARTISRWYRLGAPLGGPAPTATTNSCARPP